MHEKIFSNNVLEVEVPFLHDASSAQGRNVSDYIYFLFSSPNPLGKTA